MTADGIWGFVALEYYWLILNRRYLVTVGPAKIVGLRVGGVVVSPSRFSPGMDSPNPLDYVDSDLEDSYDGVDPFSVTALRMDSANFSIDRASVTSVAFYRAKWGMGAVPYSGRVVLYSDRRRIKELIFLGDQDGAGIARKLGAAAF